MRFRDRKAQAQDTPVNREGMSHAVVQIPVQPWLNVFALKGEGGVVLVDAGLPGQAGLILARLAEHGVAPQDVRLILITHGHADHFGSAAELRQRTGAPVAIHALDAEPLRRGSHQLQDMQASNRLVGLLLKIPGAQLVADAPAWEPDIEFEEDWRLDEYGVAGQVIHTPGHSPGSVSVLLDSGELIVGDMVMGGLMGLLPRPGDPIIAWDMARNRESIRQVQALAPRVVYASHGGPFEDLSPVWQGGPDRRAMALALGLLAGLVLFAWLLWRRRGMAD